MAGQAFYYGNPELYQQQQTLAAQQALAQQMQQQANTPLASELPQNMAVTPKLGAKNYLAKLASVLSGAYLQKSLIDKQSKLYNDQMDYTTALMTGHTITKDEAEQLGHPEAAGQYIRSPNNPQDVDPRTMARFAQQAPELYYSSVIAPTEKTKDYQQAGGDPALRREATNAQMKAQTMPSIEGGFHLTYEQGQDGKPVPKVSWFGAPPANSNASVSTNGTVSNVTPQEGAPQTIATNAQGAAAGTFAGSSHTYKDSNNREVFVEPNTDFGLFQAGRQMPNSTGAQPPAQPPAQPTAQPPSQPPAQPPAQPPSPPPVNRGIMGPVVARSAVPEQSNERAAYQTRLNDEQKTLGDRQTALQSARIAVQLMNDPRATSGVPEQVQAWERSISSAFPNSQLAKQYSGQALLRKYVANAAAFASGAMPGGDAASAAASRGGLPDFDHMPLPALDQATRDLAGRLEMGIDRTNYVSRHSNAANPDTAVQAYKAFDQSTDHRAPGGGIDYYTTKYARPVSSLPPVQQRQVGQTLNFNGKPVRWNGKAWDELHGAQ